VRTSIANGCLVLWLFFKGRLSCVSNLFSQCTLVENRAYFGPEYFCKSLQTRSHHFTLFLFREFSYYKIISDNIAMSDDIPKQLFIKHFLKNIRKFVNRRFAKMLLL